MIMYQTHGKYAKEFNVGVEASTVESEDYIDPEGLRMDMLFKYCGIAHRKSLSYIDAVMYTLDA